MMPIPGYRERESTEQGWTRSKKNDLWRNLWVEGQELTVTIFKQDDSYKWCYHDGEPHFSEERFESETEAIADVMALLGDDEPVDEYYEE